MRRRRLPAQQVAGVRRAERRAVHRVREVTGDPARLLRELYRPETNNDEIDSQTTPGNRYQWSIHRGNDYPESSSRRFSPATRPHGRRP